MNNNDEFNYSVSRIDFSFAPNKKLIIFEWETGGISSYWIDDEDTEKAGITIPEIFNYIANEWGERILQLRHVYYYETNILLQCNGEEVKDNWFKDNRERVEREKLEIEEAAERDAFEIYQKLRRRFWNKEDAPQ